MKDEERSLENIYERINLSKTSSKKFIEAVQSIVEVGASPAGDLRSPRYWKQ